MLGKRDFGWALVDMESAWALACGRQPPVTCKRTWVLLVVTEGTLRWVALLLRLLSLLVR